MSRPLLPRASAPNRTLLAALTFTAVAVLLLLPNLAWPYHDGAIFSVVGEGIWRGELPYRDLWDHKPPGIYIVASLGWPVLWVASVLAITATGLLLRLACGTFVAFIAVISLALYPVALGGGQTETLAALPTAAAVVSASRGKWALSGGLSGLALMFSLQFAALPAALVVLGGRWRFAVGVGAVVLTAGAAFAVLGLLPAAWDALVTYSRVYLQSSREGDLRDGWHLAVGLVPLAAGLQARRTRLDAAMAVWIGVTAALLLSQGRLLGHYASALVIPLALLARYPNALRRRVLIAGAAAGLLLAAVAMRSYAQRGPATELVGSWVREHTGAEQRILVWGVDANIYLTSDRAPAGRYLYIMPLVTPNYTTERMVDEWIESLRRDPPAVVVDSEAANDHWPDGEDFLRPPAPGAAGGRNLDLVQPFRTFVRENYRFVTEIEGRKIWQQIAQD